MRSRPITRAQVEKIAKAPANLIVNELGQVIGNSQALAKMCLILDLAIDEFVKDVDAACDKLGKNVEG